MAWSDVSVDTEENCGPQGTIVGAVGSRSRQAGRVGRIKRDAAAATETAPCGLARATAPRFPPKYNMKKVTDEMENYAALGDVKIVATSTGPVLVSWEDAAGRVQPRGSSARQKAAETPYPRHSVLAWSDVSVDTEENCGPRGTRLVQPRKAVAGGTPTPRYDLLVSDIEGDTTGHDAGACGTGSSSAASTGKTAGETTRRPAISDSRASCPVAPCNGAGWLHSELKEGDPVVGGKPCQALSLWGLTQCIARMLARNGAEVLDGTAWTHGGLLP